MKIAENGKWLIVSASLKHESKTTHAQKFGWKEMSLAT